MASVFLGAPLAAQASYLPGETLNPSCLPTDSTCIVTSLTASSTANSFPYYAANGSVLSATTTLTILTNNNVGIGTTTPGSLFSISGIANFTTATSTFYGNGLNLTNGCYAVNGTCLSTGATLSFTYPLINTANTISTAFGTTTANSFNQLQQFNANASTTALTVTGNTYFPGSGIWNSTGNVGIGTTSPYAKLSVAGQVVGQNFVATSTTATTTLNGGLAVGTGTSPSGLVYDRSTGFVGIGTAAPQVVLQVRSNADGNLWVRNATDFGSNLGVALVSYNDAVSPRDLLLSGNNVRLLTSGTEVLTMTGNERIGIGTTTPYAKLSVWGTDTASTTSFLVANSASTTVFAVYNNGNATYSGLIFQSSDQRLKTNITPLDAASSLDAVLGLTPVSYTRLDQSDLGTNLGFVAQDVQQIFPNLVSTSSPTALTPDGTLTLNYVGLIAPLVEALKALAGEVRNFARSVTTAVVNATTGNFTNVNTDNLCVKKSDGSNVCITGDQLGSLLDKEETPPVSTPPPPPDLFTDTPPVVVADVDVIATSTAASSVDSSSSSDPSSDTIVPTDSPASTTPSN